MKIFPLNDLLANPTPLPNSVLTIGNFDGVHLGHQAMLAQAKAVATAQNLASMVMIFEPQPREFFAPTTAPARLTNLAEKAYFIGQLGIDTLIVAGFDEAFRNLSATQFAEMLVKLNVKSLVLGDDFRFGHDRTGDSEFLSNFGLPVQTLHTITDHAHHDERISSTRVRESLAIGDLATAKHLLGRDYAITGAVLHGDKIGRTLDFPTANIALNRIKPAVHGIFGVSVTATDGTDLSTLGQNGTTGVRGLSPKSLFGACHVGTRPAVKNQQAIEWRCEVFFPQFEGDLYGKELTVTFLHFLHGEKNYDGLEALKVGIQQDVADLLAWREHGLSSN
ncbi:MULTISPECIES: riboflavin biosynthesis protein RibF [unclassified Moraxella]|uniref:riboflavin biosynthesis protein RibF n=1 Tax=unclassified Moraxella TaxID=2685852 RepID=UPI003AF96A16